MIRMLLFLVTALTVAPPAFAGPPRPATEREVADLVQRAAARKDLPAGAVVVLLDESDVHVETTGLALTKRLRVLRVQGAGGIRALSVLRDGFDPHTNRVAFDGVRIHRRGGAIEDVALDEVIVQPARQGSIFWGNRQQLLALPRLFIGDCVEIRSRRIGYNIAYLDGGADQGSSEALEPPMPGHWYEVTRFDENRPVLRKRYSVHLPSEMVIQYEVFGGALTTSLWRDGDRTVHTFVATDLPAFKGDPHMASRDDCVTKLVMATLPDWESKSRWFHRVNEGQFEADAAIRAKVAEITAGLPDEEARIAACLHWVADHIRYLGTSRGPCEGFTLHRSVETFHDRAGVCKDIAGMLITMLRVMGVEAYPALTMAGPRVEDLPADQFNHTVTVIRHADGSFQVLDPTWSPVSRELWSSREAEQGLVFGTPEGQGLTLSPFFPPEHNAVRAVLQSTIREDGTLACRQAMVLSGYPCTYLRRTLDRRPVDRRKAAIQENLRLGPTAELLMARATDPRDYSEDSRLSVVARVPGYAAAGKDVLVFRLPSLRFSLGSWLYPDLLWSLPEKGRRFPLRLRATRLLEFTGRVVLPPGYAPVALPPDQRIEGPAGALTFRCRFEGGVIKSSFTFAAKKHLVPVAEYVGFVKALAAMRKLSDIEILCRRKGGQDGR